MDESMLLVYFKPVLLNWGHLSISGNLFGCVNWGGGVPGMEWVETKVGAKHSTMLRTAPHNYELSKTSI